jgi:hypothetical protein
LGVPSEMMVRLAWGWLQCQPESEFSQWYQRRFADENLRVRKIGIGALARKLLIARWKYLEAGPPPSVLEKSLLSVSIGGHPWLIRSFLNGP